MRVVVQRCKEAQVTVNGEITGRIGQGLMVLVGVTHEDTEKDAQYLADKVAGLRIFEDGEGKMNYSVTDVGGGFCPSRSLRSTAIAAKANVRILWLRPNPIGRLSCTNVLTASCPPKGCRSKPAFSAR